MKFNNENDANSTQLEGKRLRSRGVVIDGKYVIIENEHADLERGSDEKSVIEEGVINQYLSNNFIPLKSFIEIIY